MPILLATGAAGHLLKRATNALDHRWSTPSIDNLQRDVDAAALVT
jgi:hypothetical protein